MENEIALLQDIKSALWILIFVVGVGVAAIVIRSAIAAYMAIRAEVGNMFYSSASAMYEAEQLGELVEFCLKHLKKKPKEAYAYWFLGQSHYKMKEYDKAVEYFNRAVELCPSWEKEWVGPFLAKIAAERIAPLTPQ
jgi:tetratricopeptide (TPR) repeat protein